MTIRFWIIYIQEKSLTIKKKIKSNKKVLVKKLKQGDKD